MVNLDSINAGPGDYLGRWTYQQDDKGAPPEGPLLWQLNEPKPVLFPPSFQQATPTPSNQGSMLSLPPSQRSIMPPPAAGESILQGQRGK